MITTVANKILWFLLGAGTSGISISLLFLLLTERKIKKVLPVLITLSVIILLFVSISWVYFDYWK